MMRRLVASAMRHASLARCYRRIRGSISDPERQDCSLKDFFNSLVRNDRRLVCTVASQFGVEEALRRQLVGQLTDELAATK